MHVSVEYEISCELPWIEGPLSHGLKLLEDGVLRVLTIVTAPRKHSRLIHAMTITDSVARHDGLQNSSRTALRRNFSTHDVGRPLFMTPPLPGGRWLLVGPQPCPLRPRFSFEPGPLAVHPNLAVLPVQPGVAGSQLRGIDVLPIHKDQRHGASVPVRIHDFDLHRSPVHHGRQVPLRGLAERLAGLGRVNAVKPHFHLLAPVTHHGDHIAVSNSDNLYGPCPACSGLEQHEIKKRAAPTAIVPIPPLTIHFRIHRPWLRLFHQRKFSPARRVTGRFPLVPHVPRPEPTIPLPVYCRSGWKRLVVANTYSIPANNLLVCIFSAARSTYEDKAFFRLSNSAIRVPKYPEQTGLSARGETSSKAMYGMPLHEF